MNSTDRLPERVQSLVDALRSQRALARLVDVSDGTVIGWLEGAQPYPRTLKKIAERTGVTLGWLRDGKGDMSAQLDHLRKHRPDGGSGSTVAEDDLAREEAGSIIHAAIADIVRHGSPDDRRLLEDTLLLHRRRVLDRKREG